MKTIPHRAKELPRLLRLPIGIQTFSEIRDENYAYVDKTAMAIDLITNYKYVFLARPRRFGKSLFLDTLHNIFAGEKELFKGLAAEKGYDWKSVYPVIKISFGGGDFFSYEMLLSSINYQLQCNEEWQNIPILENPSPAIRFNQLIKKTSEKYKQKVTILIDEYDKPILENIDEPNMVKQAQAILKGLYSVMKDCDKYIRFAFLTGVSKFAEVSVFSGLNNIEDITLSPRFATICGYTENDLQTTFAGYLENADMAEVKRWYDGYNFLGDHVYNPFDILLFLRNDLRFENYWFRTGTPSFLIKILQEREFFLPALSQAKTGDELLHSFNIEKIELVVLLFQSGYLAIKDVEERGAMRTYLLDFPNMEVRTSFNSSLLGVFLDAAQKRELQSGIVLALEENNMEGLKRELYAFFASIPHHNYTKNSINIYEGFYASIVYALFFSLHIEVTAEKCSNKGRIDMVIKTEKNIYLIEFKVDCNGGKAIDQIKKKGYPEMYGNEKKDIIVIGIAFSSQERNIVDFLWEKYSNEMAGEK